MSNRSIARFAGAIALVGAVVAGVATAQQPPRGGGAGVGTQGAGTAGSRSARGGIDPEADAVLRRMSEYLGGLPAFSVSADATTEVVLDSGQKISTNAVSQVSLRRPDGLRSDRREQDLDVSLFYDGRSVTVYGRRQDLFASMTAPPTIDQAIDFMRERLNLEAPAADLLYSDPYRVLTEDALSGVYLGRENVDGTLCDHIAFRGRTTDWELWVETGARPVPRRYVIVSKDVRSNPAFRVDLWNWETGPRAVTAETFTFRPPATARRIDFLETERRTAQRRQP